MIEVSQKIYDKKIEAINKKFDILKNEEALKVYETKKWADISRLTTPEGKPLYSNEIKRKEAFQLDMLGDDTHKNLKEYIMNTSKEVELLWAEISYLERLFDIKKIEEEVK